MPKGALVEEIARERHRERGAAALEFALVAPLLLALLMGIVEFGYAFNYRTQVQNYATLVARKHSLTGTDVPTSTEVSTALGVPVANVLLAPAVTVDGASGNCSTATNSGKDFTITITVKRNTLTKFFKPNYTYTAKGLGRCQ